jgi:hypothetical protein
MAKSILALVHSDKAKNSLYNVVRELSPRSKFKSLKTTQSLLDECRDSVDRVGTLFIEHGFPFPELTKTITELRERKELRPDKIILIVGEANAKEDVLAPHLSLGFSGILSMPFSEESVRKVLKISEEISMKGSIARLKVVTGLQIKSMMEQGGTKFGDSNILRAVKRACNKFESENPGKNVNDIAEEYSKIAPEDRMGTSIKDIYKGVSDRVRKLLDKKSSH